MLKQDQVLDLSSEQAFAYFARERRRTAISKGFKIENKSKPFHLNCAPPYCGRFKSCSMLFQHSSFVTELWAGIWVRA